MGPPPSSQQKEEGPAEAAPEEEERPGDLEQPTTLAAPGRRRLQIIELDGYFRLRTDYFHQFDFEQNYARAGRDVIHPPFPCPISSPPTGSTTTATDIPRCTDHNLGSANIRLRLEPTINVTESVRVMAQFDVFDNTIMGSTPDSLYNMDAIASARTDRAPTGLLYNTQNTSEPGQNSYFSSVRAKRAWGEVDSEFGSLRFGRMPWHFGRGMVFNNGSCPDCNNGTTVDRIMAITQLYGHQIAVGWDFGPQGFTNQNMNIGPATVIQQYPYDLSQKDDVTQFMAAVTRIEDPRKMEERLNRGELVLNYGAQLVYRSQSQDVQPVAENAPDQPGSPWYTNPPATPQPATNTTAPRDEVTNNLLNVNAFLFIPNVWAKLYYKAFSLEAEVSSVLGKMDHGGILTKVATDELRITSMGWVLAADVLLYGKSLLLGFETGGATGDRAEDPAQYLNYNYRFVQRPGFNNKARMTDFKFSPDYHVDEIFFRHVLGTVTNATYFKPQIAYSFDMNEGRKLSLWGAGIYSIALVPVSTPGNSVNLGAEMNLGVTYRNTSAGFHAGMIWAVFWPFGALQRPADLPIWRDNLATADASAAQALRFFLGIKF